jgi:hypothetical protein
VRRGRAKLEHQADGHAFGGCGSLWPDGLVIALVASVPPAGIEAYINAQHRHLWLVVLGFLGNHCDTMIVWVCNVWACVVWHRL